MHFASHGLSQLTLRRLARQELSRPIRLVRPQDGATSAQVDALEHALGLVVLPILAIALHLSRGDIGFLPLDLILLAAALLVARGRLATAVRR